jgi:hypothetical protein
LYIERFVDSFTGFEELANFSRRIRHATDVSSVTEGSSTNGHLQEGQEETDGYEPTTGILSSHIIFHPANSNWFRSEINRLKFGELNAFS